jgi:hypothetical protein
MTRRRLDPRIVNTHLDSNALEHSSPYQVARLLALKAEGKINLIVPQGVRLETAHPNTPAEISRTMSAQIFTLEVERSADEEGELALIKATLQGNAMSGKHAADAEHLFEAAKYGGGYFVTHDARMVRQKRSELEAVLPPSLWIVTLDEYLAIYDELVDKD